MKETPVLQGIFKERSCTKEIPVLQGILEDAGHSDVATGLESHRSFHIARRKATAFQGRGVLNLSSYISWDKAPH